MTYHYVYISHQALFVKTTLIGAIYIGPYSREVSLKELIATTTSTLRQQKN